VSGRAMSLRLGKLSTKITCNQTNNLNFKPQYNEIKVKPITNSTGLSSNRENALEFITRKITALKSINSNEEDKDIYHKLSSCE